MAANFATEQGSTFSIMNYDTYDGNRTDSDDEYIVDNITEDPLDREQDLDQEQQITGGDDLNELYGVFTFLQMENPEFCWDTQETVHSISSFKPQSTPGPSRDQPPGNCAKSYFDLFFDDEILDQIVSHTNQFASSKFEEEEEKENNGRPKKAWKELSKEELKAYIGVRILIHLLYKDRLESLWSSNENWPLVKPTGLSQVFQRDRFMEINRYLHFCSEASVPTRESADYDKLYKIRPLLDHLKNRFREEYIPDQEMSIDECMVPFRGRLAFKQYCKDKPVKFGLKVFMLAESKTGYNYNFEVYTGKDNVIEMGLCSRVVISLSQPLFNRGYHIYTDRFYTSPLLLYYLSLLGTSACGTVQCNRKYFPKEIYKTPAEMDRGDYEWKMCSNTGIVATVWCDKKPIYFLSSIHRPEYEGLTVTRKDGKGRKLHVPATPSVSEYNKHMGGVDTNDRFTAIDKSRKQYKWYGRLFIKSIMWSLYNAFILEGYFVNHMPQGSRKRDFRSFCLDVAHQLIDGFSSRQRVGRPSLSRSNHKRIVDTDHFPVLTKSNNLRCVVCTEKFKRHNGKRTKTSFICSSVQCNVPLCIKAESTCWRDWHTKVEYWR